jgi:hypothetical protein
MRVAALRTDIGHLNLDDVENSSQRNFSSEPAGQSRYFHAPTDAELTAVLAKYGITTTTLPLATLRTAVYGGATAPYASVNVASATLIALAGISALAATPQAACVADLQNLIAPSLVETGPVLLSFVYGKLHKLSNTSFQPGSPNAATIARLGYSAHAAVACVANDGSTPFVI